MTEKLTASLEDYIEAIAQLIAVDGHAHSKEIAAKLNVKMPSVTGALRQLAKMDYITYNTHQPVLLTPAGQLVANRVIHRHKVLKRFFSEILGLPSAQASDVACRIEHIVDEQTIDRLVIFSEAIGKRSDARSLQIYLTEAMANLADGGYREVCVLSELAPGESAEFLRFGRNLADAQRPPFQPGMVLTLESVSLDRSSLNVASGDRTFDVAAADAENLWVRRRA
ncbi:MAG: metal-dependent transcriptional regulator [Victivallaceae bacterium]|nr:metal-dependent transcriptional regulator [Victivallaceae bacterium]